MREERRGIRRFKGRTPALKHGDDFDRDLVERHRIVREMIKHEDHLIAGRIGRMLTAQALLFSAIVFSKDAMLREVIVPIIGLCFAWISLGNLWFANKALDTLSNWWTETYPDQRYLPDVKGYRERNPVLRWVFSERLLPLFLILGWLSILYLENCEKLFNSQCWLIGDQVVSSADRETAAETGVPSNKEADGQQ